MRLPLYSKILIWFFVNLLVVGLAIFALIRFQFQAGPELLLAGRAGDRLQAVAQLIMEEVNREPSPEWNETLERFSQAYRVQFLLYRNEGGQLAGTPTVLPLPVAQKAFMPGAQRREGRPLREGREGGGEAARDNRPGNGPPRDAQPGPGETETRGGGRPGREAARIRDSFMVRTKEPTLYWIGLRVGILERGPGRPVPATLFLVTDSLRGGGLLLDFAPFLWVGAGAVVFSVLFWLPLVRSITKALGQINAAAAQMADGRFDVRVNERRRDELGSLGRAINRMAARLSGFVNGQKRFTGDIAHELCTPIARMQMALGILEERAGPNEKAYVEDVKEEVQHMSGLVNELLSFSKASLAGSTIRLEVAALRPLVERAVHREIRSEGQVGIEVPEDLQVVADPELVVRALANLVRNAIRYAGESGPITVTASGLPGEVELLVSDSGPGVPEEELPRLFDPFYRVDTSRARETGGVGLGLSIVKTCIESCHGSVHCRNRHPRGFEVVIRLPS